MHKIMGLFFFILGSLITAGSNDLGHNGIICYKDLQSRLITVTDSGKKFKTSFYKIEDLAVAGYFDSFKLAWEEALKIEQALTEIHWKCQKTHVKFIP